MKRAPHTELKGIHPGSDIWITGSGSSLGFVDRSFFRNKLVIGMNATWKYFPATYVVIKHNEIIQEAIDAGQKVIIARHDYGEIDRDLNVHEGADYIFTHKRGRFGDREKHLQENLAAIGVDDDIFVSYSTLTSCMHLAAIMGAKNILICGHDCGYIDGASHVGAYAERNRNHHGEEGAFIECYNEWFDYANNDSERLKKRLVEVYGCNIVSLNPFINFRMEGHRYDTKKL